MEKQQKPQNLKNGDCSDELRDKSYCDEEIHSVDTDNIMSSSVGSQPQENKKIAWDTMLPSKRTNTIGTILTFVHCMFQRKLRIKLFKSKSINFCS